MNAYKAIAVDDEFLALTLIENFLQQVPGIELVAKFKAPMKAMEFLHSNPVDLLFLDIQMPVLSGNSLLKTLENPPLTIFTTAYSDYATEAFDLNAVDYLLKPFSFERFLQAINKAKTHLQMRMPTPSVIEEAVEEKSFIPIKVDGNLHKVDFEAIVCVEGWKEYVKFHLKNGKPLVTLESLKNLEDLLPADRFLRVHKSYIIAIPQVKSLVGNMLEMVDGQKVPISRNRKEEVVRVVFYG